MRRTMESRRILMAAVLCGVLTGAVGGDARTPSRDATIGERSQAAAPRTAGAEAAVAERVDEYMQAQARVNQFSGTILLARNGAPLVSKGYGWANVEWEIPNTPRTRFRLGSITKQFTSMAVMQLRQQGRLDVQDPICRHLTPCPDAWKPVTVHHLLTHTSGIPSYTNQPEYRKTMMIPKTLDDMVAGFRDLPLEFEPGSRFRYNNSGYFLLGMIIEKVAGQPYERVLRDQIFDPLGMDDTGYDRPDTILPRRASGYRRTPSGIGNAAYLDMVQPYAAGALYSTIEDLLKWDQALYTDRLLPEGARTAMFTPFKENYGYGWAVRPPSPATFNRRQIDHGGGINGFSTMIIRLPDDRISVIVLANNENAGAGRVARDLLAILLGEPYELPVVRTVATVDRSLYDSYVGEYQLAPAFILTITRDGDRLMAQATGQQKLEIFPESETKFFLKAVEAQITFVKDDQGKVTHLILHQGGRDQQAAKIK
ncbi:MAG TPA: serine hydrolase [Vicinamibacterales bacterium]|nr:serine hydrolase [Vicinamibacterales bacterium]